MTQQGISYQKAKPKQDLAESAMQEDSVMQEVKSISAILPITDPSRGLPAQEVPGTSNQGSEQPKEERGWKEIKVDVSTLPGILARLSKIRLSGQYRRLLEVAISERGDVWPN